MVRVTVIDKTLLPFHQTGVAYSKHMMQLYTYHGGDDVRQHLEVGSVLSLSLSLETDF